MGWADAAAQVQLENKTLHTSIVVAVELTEHVNSVSVPIPLAANGSAGGNRFGAEGERLNVLCAAAQRWAGALRSSHYLIASVRRPLNSSDGTVIECSRIRTPSEHCPLPGCCVAQLLSHQTMLQRRRGATSK